MRQVEFSPPSRATPIDALPPILAARRTSRAVEDVTRADGGDPIDVRPSGDRGGAERLSRKPTVAVVIPYYNGSAWIERAIRSVVAQTIPPDEFIIVNDGSRPEEREALAALAQKYRFRIIDQENGGQGSARNAGVAACECEFISFLDQDDFYLPQHIEDLVAALPPSDARLGYVYADLCGADEHGNVFLSNFLAGQTGAHPKRGHIRDLLRRDMFVLPSASLIRRSAFDALGGFDPQFVGYEDDDLFVRFFRAGFSNYFLNAPVTVWCMRGGSTSYSVRMARSRFKYFLKLGATFPDDPVNKVFVFRDCLMRRFGNHFLSDVIKAAKRQSPDYAEYCRILADYERLVWRRERVPLWRKLRIGLSTNILTRTPVRLLPAALIAIRILLLKRVLLQL
jgi:glycosyltransferase involved in cell wall biosynthesis